MPVADGVKMVSALSVSCTVPRSESGRKITVLAPGKEPMPAEALRLNRDYSLQVRLEDGREEKLASGEVSIRV